MDLFHQVSQNLFLEIDSVSVEDCQQEVTHAIDGVRQRVQQCQAASQGLVGEVVDDGRAQRFVIFFRQLIIIILKK